VTTARAETSEQRLSIYRGLVARNRLISLLRLALPVAGFAAFGWFAVNILLASLGGAFSIGSISFSGGSVIVDTPSYSGIMANGNVYKVSAEAANTPVTDLDVINLQNAKLLLTKPSGATMTATAAAGTFNTITQVMTVPGQAVISNSAGDRGTLDNVVVNLPNQTLMASGPVNIAMADGSTVVGTGLDYDAKTSIWTFGHSTVTLPQTPGSDDSKDTAP